MVRPADIFWHNKILQFKKQKNASVSECSAFLLDILQGLYEDISENIKVELLLVLQEHGEALIQSQELAEQAAGSIKSILENSQEKHEKYYVANLLITATSIIIEFELKEFNPDLVQDQIRMLMNLAKKVNQPGHAFLRKVACECLLELETAYPRITEKYLSELYKLSAREKTFVAQSYLVLFTTVFGNFLKGSMKDNELSMDASSDISISHIVEKKGKEMASFISEDYSLLTSVAKWHVGRKIPEIFQQLNMPVSILTTKFVFECSQSIDLHTLHQGVFLALSNHENLRSFHDIKMVAVGLLICISMPHLPKGFKCVCLDWFLELLQPLQTLSLDTFDFARDALQNLRPTVFSEIDVLRKKLEVIIEIVLMYQYVEFDLISLLQVPLKSANYGATGNKLATLYQIFYISFIKIEQNAIRQQIADQILRITIKNPNFIEYTVDFISAIRNGLHEPICGNLICKISDFILSLEFKEFMINCDYYLIFLEQACCEKDLWPMAIVKWLRRFCKCTGICGNGNWLTGSNILLICRGILRTHTSVLLLQELADFLWLLHEQYQHDDIKDRALFYYLTIGHTSPHHYSKLFASTETEYKMQAVSKKTDIEIPSDLMQGVLPTIRFDSEFLELTKSVKGKADRIQAISDQAYEDYSSYKEMLADKSFDRNVYLQLNIQHGKELTDDIPNKLFALTLKFSSSGPYKDIPELHLPYLSKFTKSDCSSKGEKIVLKFEPKEPRPSKISITAVFSNVNGRTCIAPLRPLEIEFSDFFNPLICPSEQGKNKETQLELFEMLWEYFGKHQRSKSNSDLLFAESVKRLITCEGKMTQILQNTLKHFLVQQEEDKSKFGIFLPPCYSILLIFKVSTEETLVRWRLDNWELLGLVENYLERLCAEG